MKLKANKLLAVILMLAAVLFCGVGCASDISSAEKSAAVSEEESLYELIIDDESSDVSAESAADISVEPLSSEQSAADDVSETGEYTEYWFRTKKLRDQHYEKHGIDMGFANADDYRKAASDVVNSPDALHKTEKEDGDDIYYIESTNEFVVVSTDGYLRTYFKPDNGKAYYDKQ